MVSVLVADDNRDMVDLLSEMITQDGHSVHSVHNGREAIDHIKKYPENLDVIITDIVMPENDGLDVVECARALTSAKIIVITGGGMFVSADRVMDSVADRVDLCLQKPVQFSKILSFLRAQENIAGYAMDVA